MNKEKEHSILKWAVAALVVLNLSTLATIFYQRNAYINKAAENSDQVSQTEKFSGRYFRDKLNLTPDQMQQFQRFNPEFRSEARTINIRLSEMRGEMLNEMASPVTDKSRLNDLSDSVGELHSNLKKITYRYYLDLKEICNPDQQSRLKELFRETFNNDGPMGSQNRGSSGGRRFRGGAKN